MRRHKRVWQRAAAVLFALSLWQVAAMALQQPLLLVSPVKVIARLASLLPEVTFWRTLGHSFLRIVAGFVLGFLLGVALGLLAGRHPLVETLLWPFLLTVKSVPVASFIILVVMWLGAARLSSFISFLMVLPIVYGNVLQGLRALDPKMLEMARVYRVSAPRRLLYLTIPQIKPFVFSASRTALGMSWKAGVAAEVIGVAGGTIGEMLYQAKLYYSIADLLAWTVVIVLASVLFERSFLYLMKAAYAALERR